MPATIEDVVARIDSFEKNVGRASQRTELIYKQLDASSRMLTNRLQYALWCVAIAAPAFFALNSNIKTILTCSTFVLTVALWLLRSAEIVLICSVMAAVVIYWLVNRWISRLELLRIKSLRFDEKAIRALSEVHKMLRDIKDMKKTAEQIPKLDLLQLEPDDFKTRPYTMTVLAALSNIQLILVVIGYILTGILVTTTTITVGGCN